ncbi:MAG TPA: type VI secretion system membrane subunit TssM [Polyangiaceae bacterium]|nr:type VI secretion system membrane subunit TssM [Polyangiaceae bacterium]
MILWVVAFLALLLIWGGGLVLGLLDVPVSIELRLVLTAIVVLGVAGWLVYRRIRAQKRAKELEAEILRQSEKQAATARPDRRAEVLELQKRMQQGIEALKSTKIGKSHGAGALYALPWYAIIGPPGAGKTTALKHSGLVFPFQDPSGGGVRGVGGTRNCDWWFTNEGILLDTAGRYATDDSDREEWMAFLGLLRKYRPQKPINGLLVAVAVSDFFEARDEQISAYAQKLRARIDEIMTKLDMVLPVYLVFTKSDLIGGFSEFFGDMRKSDRDQILGATFTLDDEVASAPGRAFATEFDKVSSGIHARSLRVLSKEANPANRSKIFSFPTEFKALRPALEQLVDELFRRNSFQENPLLRGFYFTSGTQEGKPFERVVGNMARALGIRQPPSFQSASESKSYFVTDVFRRVVFPDQDLAGRTAQELRRQRLARAGMGLAAVLIGALILLPAIVAFARNVSLASGSEELSDAPAGVQWGAASPAKPKVDTLDPVLARMQLLDGYEEDGAPFSMRWGMYQGDVVRTGLRTSYLGDLEKALLSPARRKLELDLTAIGMSSSMQPTQFGRMYDRLKLYLMLAHPEYLDVDWATPRLTVIWGQLLQDETPATNEQMTPHVRYYLESLRGDKTLAWPEDAKLVSRARTVLLRAPQLDRIYQLLISEAEEQVAPITRDTIFYGASAPYVKGKENKRVAGAYTAEGWQRIRKLLSGEQSRLSGEVWVLGEEGSSTVADVAKQIEKLRNLYFDRYRAEWKAFLADLEVARPVEATSSLDELNALSEPEWPYMRLLRILSENTTLPMEEPGEGGTVEKALKEKLEAKADELKEKVTGQAAPAVDKNRKRSPVEVSFAPMTTFAVAGEGADPASTGLAQYQAILAKLIGVMTDLRDSDTPSKTAGLEQEFQTAFRATSALLASQDGFTRPLLSPLLLRPIMGAWSGVAHDVGGAASGLWEVSVWEPWRTSLSPNYPFEDVPGDSKLDEFVTFFRPKTGTLWSFYDQNLDGAIKRTGTTFVSTRRFDSKVEFQPAFLDKCLGKGARITEAFFGVDGSEARLDFEVNLHSVSPNVSEVSLEIDGASQVYKNTPEEWLAGSWPSKAGEPGASVRIRGQSGLDEQIVREGEFGLLRLISSATKVEQGSAGGKPGGASVLVATYDFPSEHAQLVLDIRTKQGLEALSPDLFKDYECPRVITIPTN